ncbi:uncharacterized protein Dwil_GK17235 [Drosophila willistoni]|uniref:Single domain-containing protein n=1 Tax=Drosophila willistoni TaxID=7260 RepID=B4NQ53_DROWI|nr:la1-like protein 13 [Drosophila willistoni]EDW86278.1 uncharacterized protein Dwil_GK17235 [Drosophila willistoni]
MKAVTFVLCILVLGAHSLLVMAVDCESGGHKLKVGESYKPADRCVQYTCTAPGSITGKTCASAASLKPCRIVQDVTKPFPQCCPKFEC